MATPNAFWDPINKKVEERHAEEENLKRDQRAGWLKLVNDNETSDQIKNWAWGEYTKSLNPEVKKRLNTAQPLIQKIFGAISGGNKQQQRQGPVPAPAPVFDTAAANTRHLDLKQKESDIEQARQVAVAQARPVAGGTMKAEAYKLPDGSIVNIQRNTRSGQYHTLQGQPYELPEGSEPYKAPTPGTRRQYRYTVDGKEVTVFQDSKTQQMFDIHGKPFDLPEGAAPVDEEAKLAQIRGSFYGTGEFNSLKRSFKSQNPELTEDQAEQMAGAWVQEAAKRRIENIGAPRTVERPMVVGGEVQAVPFTSQNVPRPLGAPTTAPVRGLTPPSPAGTPKPAPQSGPRAAPVDGMIEPGNINLNNRPVVKNPDGTTSTVKTITIEEDGKTILIPTIVNGKSVSNADAIQHYRQTGQHMGRFSSEQAAEAYDKDLHNRMGWNGPPGSAQAQWQKSGAQTPTPAAGRTVGVPTAQYRSMLNDIRAVRAGAGQLFGDPNVPSVKGLVDYGDLADDAKSRERLGSALRLTFEGLDQATGGGHAGVGGYGAALNVGGIGTWVGNVLGVPTAVADQQAKMLQASVGALTPREREAYNATIASAEGIIGLRRITGASPSQQSVRAIQEAMPIIGVNTTDKKQFDDKSQRLAVEFAAGTRGVPRAGFDTETRKQIDEINGLPERLAKRGGTPKSAPSIPTVDTKAEYDKLQKGAEFIDKKDGKKYRKP